MNWFKRNKQTFTEEYAHKLNRLVATQDEREQEEAKEVRAKFTKKNTQEKQEYRAKRDRRKAKHEDAEQLKQEKYLATQWLPQIAASLISTSNISERDFDQYHDLFDNIAIASRQMVATLILEWTGTEEHLDADFADRWSEEVPNELGSA